MDLDFSFLYLLISIVSLNRSIMEVQHYWFSTFQQITESLAEVRWNKLRRHRMRNHSSRSVLTLNKHRKQKKWTSTAGCVLESKTIFMRIKNKTICASWILLWGSISPPVKIQEFNSWLNNQCRRELYELLKLWARKNNNKKLKWAELCRIVDVWASTWFELHTAD